MHRTKEFRAMSPWGEVAVLTHGGRTLVQSAAILEYLAATLGKFEGRTAVQRQLVREWLYWDAHRLAPPIHAMYGVHLAEQKLLPIAVEPAIADYHRKRTEAVLTTLDERLVAEQARHAGAFLVSAEPPIADICCYGDVSFAQLSGFRLDDNTAVKGWAGKVTALPGFKTSFDLLPMADTVIAV
jgi:glutathione S-transferase